MPAGSNGAAGAIGPSQLSPVRSLGPIGRVPVSSVEKVRRPLCREPGERTCESLIAEVQPDFSLRDLHPKIVRQWARGRSSTLSTRSAKHVRPTSPASVTPDEPRSPKCTTTEASRAARVLARSPINRLFLSVSIRVMATTTVASQRTGPGAPFPCYRFKSRSTGCAWTTWPRTN